MSLVRKIKPIFLIINIIEMFLIYIQRVYSLYSHLRGDCLNIPCDIDIKTS